MARLPIVEVTQCIDRLVTAQILVQDRADFCHPIVREVVYTTMGPALRQDLHHRSARVLTDQSSLREAAGHLVDSGLRGEEWETPTLRAAASAHFTAGAPDRAAEFLRLAFDVVSPTQRSDVLIELGRAELAAGETSAAARFRDALASKSEPSPELDLEIGEWLYAGGMFTDAMQAFAEGLGSLGRNPDPVTEARLLVGLDTAGLLSGIHPEAAAARVAATFGRSRHLSDAGRADPDDDGGRRGCPGGRPPLSRGQPPRRRRAHRCPARFTRPCPVGAAGGRAGLLR